MAKIISVGTALPPYQINQQDAEQFVYQLYKETYPKISRLLSVFKNGGIQTRYMAKQLEWYGMVHSFEEKNEVFIEEAVKLGSEAIQDCLQQSHAELIDIDAIITICSTGLSTPSLEARLLNVLPLQKTVKRIPIWGLGCAGGASGLARAHDYCRAWPNANVLVLAVELCSLTFQLEDLSKSNLIGTSLFADGAACVLVSGENSRLYKNANKVRPLITQSHSVLMEDSLDVMGWKIKNNGLFVVFSKDIPSIVKTWVQPSLTEFLSNNQLTIKDITHLVAHPGGRKVLEAYEEGLELSHSMTAGSRKVLERYGNMSSVTVLFVLKHYLEKALQAGETGLLMALGPGFSSDMLLLRWE